MRILFTLSLFFIIIPSFSQEVTVVKFDRIEQLISERTESIKVINFWATWCKPCIEELPEFEKVNTKPGVEVYLVSLDFVEEIDKVSKFAVKKGLKSKILLLDDISYDEFIPKVSESWSGVIPATLLINGKTGKSVFYEKQFKGEELLAALNKFMRL